MNTESAVFRLRAALDYGQRAPAATVEVRTEDLAAVLADMPCVVCYWRESVKAQSETIRNLQLHIDALGCVNRPGTDHGGAVLARVQSAATAGVDVPPCPSLVIHARICRVAGCDRNHDDWGEMGIGR